MPATHGHAVQISAGMFARAERVVTDAAMCDGVGPSPYGSSYMASIMLTVFTLVCATR